MQVNFSVIDSNTQSHVALRKQMGTIVVETVRGIAKDNFERLQGCSDRLQLLSGGIWYASDYYLALKKWAPTNESVKDRLKFFRDRDFFYHPYIGNNYFELVPSENSLSGFLFNQIQIKKDVSASSALKGLIEERRLAVLDCTMVCQIGQYEALHQVLGNKKFDKLFNRQSSLPMKIGNYAQVDNPLRLFLKFITGPAAIGQRHACANISLYVQKHQLMGEMTAINMIVSNETAGQEEYVALGFSPQGFTESKIEECLISEHNKPPFTIDALSDRMVKKLLPAGSKPYELFCELCKSPTEEIKNQLEKVLIELGGGTLDDVKKHVQSQAALAKQLTVAEAKQSQPDFPKRENILDFEIDLIQKIIELPLQQVSMDFVRNYKRSNSSY